MLFNHAIVKVLGLEAKKVRKLTITCEHDCVPVVDVEMFVDPFVVDESSHELLTELRRYELIEREAT